MINGENECSGGCEDAPKKKKKETRVGKLLLVPMNSESQEMSAWGLTLGYTTSCRSLNRH